MTSRESCFAVEAVSGKYLDVVLYFLRTMVQICFMLNYKHDWIRTNYNETKWMECWMFVVASENARKQAVTCNV